MNEHETFDVTQYDPFELVAQEDGCPACGERFADKLTWQVDGDYVYCATCGAAYFLNDGRASELAPGTYVPSR